jgi:TM2 domain-containing membrane protein YozV
MAAPGTVPQAVATPPAYYIPPPQPKTRVVFVLLGIFLGALGIHNFYAGYIKKAALQLCLTLLTLGWGAVVSWPWAIIEICVINKDADGMQFV